MLLSSTRYGMVQVKVKVGSVLRRATESLFEFTEKISRSLMRKRLRRGLTVVSLRDRARLRVKRLSVDVVV